MGDVHISTIGSHVCADVVRGLVWPGVLAAARAAQLK